MMKMSTSHNASKSVTHISPWCPDTLLRLSEYQSPAINGRTADVKMIIMWVLTTAHRCLISFVLCVTGKG